jgi:phage virion morphogenesis protein
MSASIELRPLDAARLDRAFKRLLERADDLTPLMERIGMAGEALTIERFETETAPDGASWLPSTRAKETGGSTLTDQGFLRQSITHRATATTAEVGTNLRYAGVHQEGATIRGNPHLKFKLPGDLGFRTVEEVVIPARPFLGSSAELEAEIVDLATEYLTELGG